MRLDQPRSSPQASTSTRSVPEHARKPPPRPHDGSTRSGPRRSTSSGRRGVRPRSWRDGLAVCDVDSRSPCDVFDRPQVVRDRCRLRRTDLVPQRRPCAARTPTRWQDGVGEGTSATGRERDSASSRARASAWRDQDPFAFTEALVTGTLPQFPAGARYCARNAIRPLTGTV